MDILYISTDQQFISFFGKKMQIKMRAFLQGIPRKTVIFTVTPIGYSRDVLNEKWRKPSYPNYFACFIAIEGMVDLENNPLTGREIWGAIDPDLNPQWMPPKNGWVDDCDTMQTWVDDKLKQYKACEDMGGAARSSFHVTC